MNYTVNIDRLVLENMSPREIEKFKKSLQKEISAKLDTTSENSTSQKKTGKQADPAVSIAASIAQKLSRAESTGGKND